MEWRPPAPGASEPTVGAEPDTLDEDLYRSVTAFVHDGSTDGLTVRELLAIEYAARFCDDHEAIDDDLFARLRAAFDDGQIYDLTVCVARFLSMGRITQVLKLDQECPLPMPRPTSG